MGWSLGETRALAVKAARGAGLSWGLSEEAGFAVYWLQRCGAPGARALAAYLDWLDRQPAPALAAAAAQLDLTRIGCPLRLGAALSDTAGVAMPRRFDRVCQPLLLSPFVAAASAAPRRLSWSDVVVSVGPEGLTWTVPAAQLLTERTGVAISVETPSTPQPRRCARVAGDENDAVATLTRFAARTYAPASERSRLTGAGAVDDDG